MGVTVVSADGVLAWQTMLSERFFTLRKQEQKVRKIVHIGIVVTLLLCLGWSVWSFMQRPPLQTSGWFHPDMGLGILLGCFLLFRVRRDQDSVSPLPNWALSGRTLAAHEARAAGPNVCL